MHLDHYDVIINSRRDEFIFFSKGPKGIIVKSVRYQKGGNESFNLAFGDLEDEYQRFNDMARVNNGDGKKILITVVVTILTFLESHPGSTVLIRGNTESKRRLYRMGINYALKQLGHLLEIEGFLNEVWEAFRSNKNYDAFAIRVRRKD